MPTVMPDIANQSSAINEGTLERVGMSNIRMPMMLELANQQVQVDANVEAFVNLIDAKAKGIHMSRLYLQLEKLSTEGHLSYAGIKSLLEFFIISHESLSDTAFVKFDFNLPLRRQSLLSQKTGWKSYPVTVIGTLNADKIEIELIVNVPYSSTCPCSAALARQLIQQAFDNKFAEQTMVSKEHVQEWLGTTEGIVATPHSQRSVAEIKIKLSSTCQELMFVQIIDAAESALQTPVQAAVKREDEQEFARLNGQNLMFCEDAARRLQHTLNLVEDVTDFRIRVNHYESLHDHDAVSVATKGIEHGYTA